MIDQANSSHSFRELKNTSQVCDDKSPIMLEEIAEITEKDVLPVMGFTYAGNMDVEGQELFINLGPLICQPNLEFEAQHSVQNQLAYLEDRINSTDEVLVNQGEDLATLKVFILHLIHRIMYNYLSLVLLFISKITN